MADREKRVTASTEKPAPSQEQLTTPVPAELSFDEFGNRWVLGTFMEDKGLKLKMLVKPAGMEDKYEYEIWQGAERVLSSSDNEWQHRMHDEFSECIKVFDGMRQRWLLQRDATDSVWNAFFPKAESYGNSKPDEHSDAYSRWAKGMQHELGEVFERALKSGQGIIIESLEVIAAAVEAKDPDTLGHSQRVACYAKILAKELGLTEEEMEKVRVAAILHDMGKIGVGAKLLRKPGVLTNEEFEIMKSHTVLGFEMVRNIKELQDIPFLIRSHHERYDGKGYPDGLAGDGIPLGARIVSVANALDAMTCASPYRRALSFSEARERIAGEAGKQFDPVVVDAFLRIPDEVWNNALAASE
jgi:putative nucleotidyltransferase with HDIG domain